MKKVFRLHLLLSLLLAFTFQNCDKEVSVTEPNPRIPKNKIIIQSQPAGAAIFVNGDNSGKFTPDSLVFLEPGNYNIVLKQPLFIDDSSTVSLINDTKYILNVNFYEDTRNYAKVFCTSNVPFCRIFINDSLTIPSTPHLFNRMWPGIYKIKYTYPEHRADSTFITVNAQDSLGVYITLQDTTYAVDYSKTNSGFPTGLTWCVDIDDEQHKWIGTRQNGVVVYDDANWIVYNSSNSILPSNAITSLKIDEQSRKWIGTPMGLVLIDEVGTWRLFTTENSQLANNYIAEIDFDSKGNTWIGACTPGGVKALVKYDGVSFSNYPVTYYITAMAVDNEDLVWVGTDMKISVFDGTQWLTELTDSMRTQGQLIDALACDKSGRILFGIRSSDPAVPSGLYAYNKSDSGLEHCGNMPVSYIFVTDNDNIWICSYGKFQFTEPPPNLPMLYKLDYQFNSTGYSMRSSTIKGFFLLCAAAQSNGDLWLASRYTGIIKFKGANL